MVRQPWDKLVQEHNKVRVPALYSDARHVASAVDVAGSRGLELGSTLVPGLGSRLEQQEHSTRPLRNTELLFDRTIRLRTLLERRSRQHKR